MKFWTYKEASTKVITDLDLQDQVFVTQNEMIGYFNEGLRETTSEILKLNEDYFLSQWAMPLVQGQANYGYPPDIFARKIRGIEYANGAIIYPVFRIRNMNKFDIIALANQYAVNDWYTYYTMNQGVGQDKLVLVPPARETAILTPLASPSFTPMIMWYIRNFKRIPLVGEFVLNYAQFLPSDVDTGADQITVAGTYQTGDQVQLAALYPGAVAPTGLSFGTTYFVIAPGGGVIELATSRADAFAGNSIDITAAGSGIFSLAIAATQTIVDTTLIDVPEFVEFVMQWVKCRCMEKEGDPRLEGATATLQHLRSQMIDTLTQAEPDNEDTIQQDLSLYRDLS